MVGNLEIRSILWRIRLSQGSIVGIGIETIHFEYAARKDIHDIISLQLDNIHFRLLLERHIVIDQFANEASSSLVRQTDRRVADKATSSKPKRFSLMMAWEMSSTS